MRYISLRINAEKNNWKVLYIQDEQERVKKKTKPNAMGFYHFPETMPPEQALNELVACMAKRHIKEIERLQKSLNKLLDLQAR